MSNFLSEAPLNPKTTSPSLNNNNNDIIDNVYQPDTTSRKIEFDRGNPLSYNFISNKVSTIPYTVPGFFIFLYKSIFLNPINIVLLFVLVFYLITYIATPKEIEHLNVYSTITFHIIIIIIEILFYIYRYIEMYLHDQKINNQPSKVYDTESRSFKDSKWKDICVGNIVKVNKNEVAPADMIILEAMDHSHQCYVDYSSVNGVFDSFAVKKACSDTHAPSMRTIKFSEYVKNIKGVLKYEEPNGNMHSFTGRLKLESFPRASDVTIENFVMRGTTIKNIKWIYGLVVYTGMETKIMQTLQNEDIMDYEGNNLTITNINNNVNGVGSSSSNSYYYNKKQQQRKIILKKDRDMFRVTLLNIQYLLIVLYVVVIVLAGLIELQKSCLCYYSFLDSDVLHHWYLGFADMSRKQRATNPFFEMYLSFVAYLLTFFLLFPFDWFLVVEITYSLMAWFIKWDTKIKRSFKNKVEIINNNCLSNFGNVRHILTDKTGTLTARKYKLKLCLIQGKLFSFENNDKCDENYIFRKKTSNNNNNTHSNTESSVNSDNTLIDSEIYQELKSNSKFSNTLRYFFTALSLCHTAKVVDTTSMQGGGSSSDDNNNNNNNNVKDGIGVGVGGDVNGNTCSNQINNNNNNNNGGQHCCMNNNTKKNKVYFTSTFAEELAMLKMFSKLGYKVQKTKKTRTTLNIDNTNNYTYSIIGINKYTEDRHRMSIVVRGLDTSNINGSTLICKSHDPSIFTYIKQSSPSIQALISKTKLLIKDLSKYGTRAFVFCKRELSEDETLNFIKKYKSAENYVIKSEEHLHNLAVEYEQNMELLGVLFFQEKVSDDTKFTIRNLTNVGIKVWIASGDKRENVLAVGKNLNLYNKNTIIGDFSDKDKPEDLDIKMSMLLMQFLFPNEKISKMKTRKGVNVEATVFKGSKDLTILISGNCFSRICADQRNCQSLATLLSYCTNLLAYNFSASNKYYLCKMIKYYSSKNSKVLAIGDGFNDFMMLKEADLSIGILSREIMQVTNTCDIIVSKFPQILDLILVHGSFNYQKLMSIALCSFYVNFIIIFPILLHQNANPYGSCFYFESPVSLVCDIFILNLGILFYFSFDYSIERSTVGLNANIYKENFYDLKRILFEFGIEMIRAGADSLILYYLFFLLVNPVNIDGENIDVLILGSAILYTSYVIVIVKILFLRLKTITHFDILITLILVCLFVSVVFFNNAEKQSTIQGFSYLPIVLQSIFVIGFCYIYERVVIAIFELISPYFLWSYMKLFHKLIKKNMFFKNFQNMHLQLAKETPLVISKVDKMTYPEVLHQIHCRNGIIDPALENMADVNNDEVAKLKIDKYFLTYTDKKLENDYISYNTVKIVRMFIIYFFIMAIYVLVDCIVEGFDGQYVSKIFKICYIILGLCLLLPCLKKEFQKYFTLYFYIILTIEIICIYVERTNNDVKICIQFIFFFACPLFYSSGYFKMFVYSIIYYTIAIMPSIYFNDFGFKAISNQTYFLYSNLYLIYHRSFFLILGSTILIVFSYFSELKHRIDYLKYHKSKNELKKDNHIMANLVPDFVREKMKRGERGAALGYEVVSIVFCDFSDFDSLVAKLSPKDLIAFLDEVYSMFDQFCFLHGLQKIETVGKTYMAAGGIKECEVNVSEFTLRTHHAIRCFEFSVDILDLIQKMILTNGEKVKVKIGIHTGKVIPAVVGNHKPQFSLIGDTVNTTARMCSNSQENCINCSEFAYEEIKQRYKDFTVTTKEIKGKGMMNLYLFNPNKNKKKGDNSKLPFPKDSNGNIIMKSVTRNMNMPIMVKQGTKGSMRRMSKGDNLIKNKNDLSVNTGVRKNSLLENSLLIVENSYDELIDTNNNFNYNVFGTNTNNNLINNRSNTKHKNQLVNAYNNNNNNISSTINPYDLKQGDEIEYNNNDFFKNSFFFFKFTNETSHNGFIRYEKQKFLSSEVQSMIINFAIVMVFLVGMFLISQYALEIEDHIALFIIAKAIILMVIVGLIVKTQLVIHNYSLALSWMNFAVYLALTIINQIQLNDCSKKFYLSYTVEEVTTIIAMCLNGMLSYMQITLSLSVHVIIFIVNIIINKNEHLIVKYNIMLIYECIVLYILTFTKCYYSSFDFLLNQKQAKNLVDTEKMLFNLMPLHVVQNMKDDIPVADVIDNVTLLFADIVRFTDFSACHEPVEVVNLVSELFKRFDNSTKECSVYKVHTIGDCYVVMSFTGKVPMNERNYLEEAKNVCKMGESMIRIIREVRKEVNFEKLDMRIGIHTGPIIAGIIGSAVVRYDLFGSDVLIANKMESAGCPGKINISEDTKKLLETKEMPYALSFNKVVDVPSVGREVKSYFIESANDNNN